MIKLVTDFYKDLQINSFIVNFYKTFINNRISQKNFMKICD